MSDASNLCSEHSYAQVRSEPPVTLTRGLSHVQEDWLSVAPIPADVIEARITTADASRLAGVSVATIRKWVQREHLAVDCRDGRGRPLFRWIDVAKAERLTRDHARRKFAA